MDYAYPNNAALVASMPIKQNKMLSEEVRARRNYIKNHSIAVHIDSSDDSVSFEVTENKCLPD